jgi:hypothetical protein
VAGRTLKPSPAGGPCSLPLQKLTARGGGRRCLAFNTLADKQERDLGDWRWSDDELCESAEVLRDCCQCELELSASRTAQAQTTEPKDALEMGKQHLNAFAIVARSFECFGLS